ncbi:flagellar hook-basal body protein [Lachnoclostridium phytofermentans]|uniref:Flagellar basal body rod protein n=1 Tax=Lachnoclostridium phytofermentans (strain ATCC 700394 / DSM 18823 / ISDg) TaxID=357809 RepID=A9KRZ9_LACP7|nr:flagellar hook-basal body protein [Lachnoclostridium phytofermentans]ABX40630.1 flagellar basal body rod protein [Lachnoclostridium phytofermentans ISDg]
MVRGLYTGWTGMENEQKRLDIISNNLANSATVGYKKEGVTNQSFDDVLTLKIRDESENFTDKRIGKMTLGVKLGEVYTDYTQGSLRETGNTFDFAIEGSGFFKMEVLDKDGNSKERYTRAGQFLMDKEGYVVDVNGNHLMSEGGYLQVPTDASQIVIDLQGNVFADGAQVDKLVVTDFENYDYLKKFGESMYEAVDGARVKDTAAGIRQGYTEQSNVNVVSEMVNMIAITRAYEANQKVLQSIDGTLELAANSIGKI